MHILCMCALYMCGALGTGPGCDWLGHHLVEIVCYVQNKILGIPACMTVVYMYMQYMYAIHVHVMTLCLFWNFQNMSAGLYMYILT